MGKDATEGGKCFKFVFKSERSGNGKKENLYTKYEKNHLNSMQNEKMASKRMAKKRKRMLVLVKIMHDSQGKSSKADKAVTLEKNNVFSSKAVGNVVAATFSDMTLRHIRTYYRN